MDRDAAPRLSAPAEQDLAEVVPQAEWVTVRKIGLVGVGLLAAAAALGPVAPGSTAWPHTVRLFLVLFGAVTAGAAVSMRPDLWKSWAIGTGAAVLAIAGTPAHWDSFRLLFSVMAVVAAVWTAVRLAPPVYRVRIISALLLFHFTGIFLATTTPPQTPWVTEQAFVRVFNPYLQFLYLRNAYHFYSPEPGAASVLVFLLKTETGRDPVTGDKQYATKWVVLPKRPGDVKDPLGLTYYRRLSITEQLARGTPGLRAASFEAREMRGRRQLAPIPMHPSDAQEVQYQLPQPEVTRFILPSYASHVILENTPNKEAAAKTTVKVYRLQHNTMGIEDFIDWRKRLGPLKSPYHPMWYRPFFLGEFGFVQDADRPGSVQIELVNPQEPMLYWLVPIMPRPGGLPPGETTKREFLDYMSFHALGPEGLGPETTVDDLGDPKFKDRVFDWTQLR
ncbi:hypothetical protein [Frigoriglobus tundricola]|uniref:Uncharacterized protein n=1 Tax=Frigoriglobus tundricola TaxID=2774151 RepID=A0A6M5YVK5_9BACT|nr:hypothetical protein [Frigoriglobus tundricola]QJW97406.1 hypothetical protein FTUN_4980 [Frigoriglobus tundricola]